MEELCDVGQIALDGFRIVAWTLVDRW